MKHDLLRPSGSFCPDKAGGSISDDHGRPCLLDSLKSQPVWGGCVYLNGSSYVIPGKDNTGKSVEAIFPLAESRCRSLLEGGTRPVPDAPGSTDHACSLLLQVSASIYKATSPFITVTTLCLVLLTAVSVPCP